MCIKKYNIKFYKTISNSIFFLFFICFLCFPSSQINPSDILEQENRSLTDFPKLFIDKKINSNFSLDFENWFNDSFRGRREFIKIYDDIIEILSNRVENKSAFLGKDNWIFYKGTYSIQNFRNISTYDTSEMRNSAHYWQNLFLSLQKQNTHLYFFIAPDKHRIYGEFYPDYYVKVKKDSENRTWDFINIFKQYTDIPIIYPYEHFLEIKKQDLIYWKQDTHWNKLGAYYGYLLLMEKIREKYPNIPVFKAETFGKAQYFEGDLAKMLPGIDVDYTEYTVPILPAQNYKSTKIENSKWENAETIYRDGKGTLSLLLFSDSFGLYLVPYLMESFKEVHLIRGVEEHSASIIDFAPYDIVVSENVERYLKRPLVWQVEN